MINGMNLGVDPFILNPVPTHTQCLEVKNHHCGQISGQGGSYNCGQEAGAQTQAASPES